MPAPIFCDRCGDSVTEECNPMDELAHVDALLERLTLKRYELKRKINRFHNPIIRQLPSDVVSTIFEFCIPNFLDFRDYPCLSKVGYSDPLSLGAICSYWREIAWSTPRLWTSLAVPVNLSNFDSQMVIVQEWLARSGQLPLSIRISVDIITSVKSPTFKGLRKAIQALANVINQYFTRWSDLVLSMSSYLYQYFHANDNSASILKSIKLYDSGIRGIEGIGIDKGSFQLTCPRLERATLSFSEIGSNEINITWHNLTHIHLDNMPIEQCFTILRRTPRLLFCKFYHVEGRLDEVQGTPLVLASLRSLLIMGDYKNILCCLVTPNLKKFSLEPEDLSMEALNLFFKRSACPLHCFSITFTLKENFDLFIRLLQSIPSLKRLSITSDEYHPQNSHFYDLRMAFQLVTRVLSSQSTTSQQGFLPNLEVFEYTADQRCSQDFAGPYPLSAAIADYTAAHCPFRLLKLSDIYSTDHIPKNDLDYFLTLAERGAKVDVLSKSKDMLQSSIDYYRERREVVCVD